MRQEADSRDEVMQNEKSDLYFLKKKISIVEKWRQKRRNEFCEWAEQR